MTATSANNRALSELDSSLTIPVLTVNSALQIQDTSRQSWCSPTRIGAAVIAFALMTYFVHHQSQNSP